MDENSTLQDVGNSREASLSLCPKKVGRCLLAVLVLLLVANLVAVFSALKPNQPSWQEELAGRFFFDAEANVPTWFSSTMMLSSAVLLSLIGLAHRQDKTPHRQEKNRDAIYWFGWSALFLLLSVDEIASFHELMSTRVRQFLNVGGLLYYGWVVPGALFVALMGIVYLRFLLRLDRRTKVLFSLSGALFLGGSLGLEMVGGYLFDTYGDTAQVGYFVVSTIEESLEMCGVTFFVYALVDYMTRHGIVVRCRFGSAS